VIKTFEKEDHSYINSLKNSVSKAQKAMRRLDTVHFIDSEGNNSESNDPRP